MLNKAQKYLIPFLGAITLIVNIFAYNFLPEKIGMQINTSGELRNYVSKPIFIIIAPAVMAVMYLLHKGSDNVNKSKYLSISVIIFIVNILSIFFNI